MSLAKGLLIGIGGVGALGAGGYLAFRSQQPTDVRSKLVWDGLSVAESKSLGVYKALYLANHSKDGFSSFISNAKDKDAAAPLLKARCNELLGISASSKEYQKSLEEAKKWCLIPESETIEINLHLEDAEFSSSDEDYKSILALSKGDQSFVNAIKNGASGSTLDANADFSKVKSWCEETLKKPVNPLDLKNSKSWCLKGPVSIKEKLAKDGLKMMGDGGWQRGFKKHKAESSFFTDIGENSQPQLEDIQGGEKLKTWCTKNLEGKLYENNNYPETYNKVKKYCVSN
nr:hypothetical protein [Mycoplasma haemocanis]